jgi:hypothetical protein
MEATQAKTVARVDQYLSMSFADGKQLYKLALRVQVMSFIPEFEFG